MKKLKINPYKLLGAVISAAVLFAVCAYSGGLFSMSEPNEIAGKLSDCFTVAGVIFFGVGAISLMGSSGAYDILGYGVDFVIKPFTSRRKDDESFYEYKQRKAENRKPWLKEFFIVGLVMLLFAGISLAAYYML